MKQIQLKHLVCATKLRFMKNTCATASRFIVTQRFSSIYLYILEDQKKIKTTHMLIIFIFIL